MHKKIYNFFILFILGIVFLKLNAQNFITNSDFYSNITSWTAIKKRMSTTDGSVHYSPKKKNNNIDTDTDGDGIPDNLDFDSDNDGILNSEENAHCGVPAYTYPGQTTPGYVINELFFENFGSMNTSNGTTSVQLSAIGTGATTTYNYYQANYGNVPTNWQDGTGYPQSLQDGRYTIFNNISYTSSWAGSQWQTIGDHTGGSATPGNGRMFIVNASTAPGEFYRRTLTGVIQGAPINASLWAMNIDVASSSNNGRNLPNITVRFVQNGSVVYSFNTGDIPREAKGSFSAWKQFQNSTVFIPSSSDPIDVVLINNAPGGAGNDLAIDDIIIYQSMCDTDRDGIPDYLDKDSDGDGCPDAIEGTENITNADLNPDGSISGATDIQGVPSKVNPGGSADVNGVQGQGKGSSANAAVSACQDSDGDGVFDNLDLDTDNDGILDTDECYGEKISNGTFDSNTDGWTFNSAVWGRAANRMSSTNDNSSNSPLTQVLNPLSTQLYKLSFTLAASDFGGSDMRTASITVRLGGVVYGVFNNGTGKTNNVTLTLSNGAVSDFSPFSTPGNGEVSRNVTMYLPYTYSSAQTNAIDFIVTSNGDDWFLDNISLMGGCDTDGDGIPNYLDLDSDNDGCLDALEGDDKVLISDLVSAGGSLTVGNGSTASNQNLCANATCVDAQGVPIVVNPGGSADLDGVQGQGKGSSANATVFACKDSDGDGIPDIYDLDDDNDGIPDCEENGFTGPVSSYFQLNGSAFDSSFYEITLTPATNSQSGQAWSKGKVDFSKSFKLRFEANLGSNVGGADGIAIVFQNDPNGINATGADGNGIGARGIQNGLALELDTYSNTTAPASDPGGSNGHGRIWRTVDQSNLTNNIELGNLKDGNWRDVEIVWDVDTQNITYYVNGTNAGSHTFSSGGIANQIFGGESKVYFGYTASTGALNNLQRVRFVDPCIDLPLELDTDGDGIPDYLDLDSDNDGCLDALEGGDNVITSQLVSASVGLSVGTGSSASNQNLCADGSCVDAQGVPTVVNAGGAADIDGAQGQSIGSSKDETVNSCLNFCTTGCNNNTYVNAVDPNTIEYDNIIGLYHSTMAKEADGTVKIWGQGAAYNGTGITGNILTPQIINSTNYPGLTGDILRFAGASGGNKQQFAVLTTTGLFVWGDTDVLVPTDVKNSNVFGSIAVGTYGVAGTKADGLPAGVAPGDVKMMFGTERTFSIVTCSGQAWMLSRQGYLYGDGATDNSANDMVWHRVSTAAGVPLTNVVAARGAYYGMMALTSNGEIYTWGRETRLGNNTAPADRLYATLMEKPSGVTPKMIGMTYQYGTSTDELTYYLLGTNGNLYSMGGNRDRQLGNGTTTASDSWINVTATDKGASLGGNVVWISPNEHDSNDSPSINVLTTDAKLWAWGHNHAGMLDGSSNATINPTYMPGSITGAYNKGKLNLTDKLIAVETGGHTSITIKECSTKFGYVGHRVRGSMADGTTGDNYEVNYNFSDTSALSICGALTGPVVEDLKICVGQTADLADAVPGTLPPGVTIEWWTTIDKLPGTQVTNTSSVPAGTYYAFYVGANPVGIACPSAITIDNAACACYKPGLTTGGDVLDTKVGITSLSRAGADNPDNWPMIRKGGWIALESKTKGFVPNRVAFEDADSDPATPDVPVGIPAADFIEGMMVYDTTNKCMKMYTLKEGDASMAWHCIVTQACPD